MDRYKPLLGGAQNNVHELAKRLAWDYGMNISVVTRRLSRELERAEVIDGISVSRYGYMPIRVVSKIAAMIRITIDLIKRRREYDAVLCVPCAYYTDILPGFIASLFTGKPYILRTTMSGNFDFMLGGRTRRSGTAGRSFIPAVIYRKALERAAHIVVQSKSIYESGRGYGLTNMKLVESGVDTERFRPAAAGEKCSLRGRLGLSEDRPVVITTGRYVEGKNQIIVIRAVEELINKGLAPTAVIIGATEKGQVTSNEHALKNYVEKRGIKEYVKFFDDVDNVEDYLRASDIYMFPTKFDEGMPNALLEAMACGLPVVASNIPPVKSVVPEYAGVCLDPDDVLGFSEAVERFVSDTQRARYCGEQLASHARRHYSIRRVAEDYARLLEPYGRPYGVENF